MKSTNILININTNTYIYEYDRVLQNSNVVSIIRVSEFIQWKGKKGHEIELIEKINEKQQLITSDFILICLQQIRKYIAQKVTHTHTSYVFTCYYIFVIEIKLFTRDTRKFIFNKVWGRSCKNVFIQWHCLKEKLQHWQQATGVVRVRAQAQPFLCPSPASLKEERFLIRDLKVSRNQNYPIQSKWKKQFHSIPNDTNRKKKKRICNIQISSASLTEPSPKPRLKAIYSQSQYIMNPGSTAVGRRRTSGSFGFGSNEYNKVICNYE